MSSGLSPLARGNQRYRLESGQLQGPIPARAGQPVVDGGARHAERAYPRSRGATLLTAKSRAMPLGLSPLARGNQQLDALEHVAEGPIPARAGQPRSSTSGCRAPWAYPRSRGATSGVGTSIVAYRGLSPLARGNRLPSGRVDGRAGPIPARAGQPAASRPRARWGRAYPRSRGATHRQDVRRAAVQGLSPLARGNQARAPVPGAGEGPIPARAGQPPSDHALPRSQWAYPRSRGATSPHQRHLPPATGLSPLARGNPQAVVGARQDDGPIPARAGQPASSRWPCRW